MTTTFYSGDQLAGKEEGVCVLHQQVEPTAGLPRSHSGNTQFSLFNCRSHFTSLGYLSISLINQHLLSINLMYSAPGAPATASHWADGRGAGQPDSPPQCNFPSWNMCHTFPRSSMWLSNLNFPECNFWTELQETHVRPYHFSGHLAQQAGGVQHPGHLFSRDLRPVSGKHHFLVDNLTPTLMNI